MVQSFSVMLAEANLVVLYFVIGQIEFLPNPIGRIEFRRAGQLTTISW